MISFKEFCRCKSIREDWGKTSPIPKEVYKFPSGEEDENSTLWDALTDRIRDVFDGININRQGNKYFRTSSAAYRETLGKLQKVVAGARQENFSAMHTGKLVMWLILLEGLFLDSRICDEIGLLVINEVPGWQFVSKKQEWRDNFMTFLTKMILTERNHPSLIAHGVRIDESIDDHNLYSKANELAHSLDPYRQTLGVRNFKNSELLEDIYAYNDFICSDLKVGLINPKHVKHQSKPYLVTEYMGHMDPYKATADLDRKIEVARRHMKVLDDSFKYVKVSGAIGWCFVDYHTHIDFGSGDHICAHGVMDMYRNPKFSSYVYQSQREDKPILEVLSNIKPGDVAEAVYGDIYVATNCDYVSLFKNDEYVGDFYPNKKEYKHVKHPLILIDDIVGKTFKEERFQEKHWARMGKTFSYYAIHGFNKMKLKDSLFLGRMMLKYKMKYDDLVYYWNKHVASWGGIAKKWTFKGYKDNKEVIVKEIGPSKVFDLKVETNRTTLESRDTYDVTRVKVSHVDEYDSLMYYSQRIISIKTEGAIALIGDENQTLLGGQLSIYVRSKEKGQGKLTLKMDNIEKAIEFEVI